MIPSGGLSSRVALVTLLVVSPVTAQRSTARADSVKTATVRRLLDLTNAAGTIVSTVEAMVPAQRSADPDIPTTFWNVFLDHVKHELPQLIDSLVPVYSTRFTQAELDQMVQFYSSPTGRHLSQSQIEIVQQNYAIGRHWGERIGTAIQDSLRNSGGVWAEMAATAAMKTDLRNLVTSEEAYFADSVRYTITLGPGGLDFQLSPDNTIEVFRLTADGWVATMRNAKTKITCSIFIGSTSLPPAVVEGRPTCQ